MHVGLLQFELLIPHAESLKDKRRVVKSLKDRLHREHLVSVAEVDSLDDPRRAVLGLAIVANEVPYISSVIDRVLEKVRHTHEARLGAVLRDVVHGSTLDWSEGEGEANDPEWAGEEQAMIESAERLLRERNS